MENFVVKFENGSYFLENDNDNLKKYDDFVCDNHNDEYKNNYKIHLEVLPQPFFGNITDPKILVLAKNPSFDEFGDELDTKTYLMKRKIDEYINDIQKVDFTQNLDVDEYLKIINSEKNKFSDNDINYVFFNTWKWWKKNVFGNIQLTDDYKESLCCLNLNGYHSKYYNDVKDNKEISNAYLKNILNKFEKVEFIIVVWGKKMWDEVIEESENETLKEKYKNNAIVLNKGSNLTPISSRIENNQMLKKYFNLSNK